MKINIAVGYQLGQTWEHVESVEYSNHQFCGHYLLNFEPWPHGYGSWLNQKRVSWGKHIINIIFIKHSRQNSVPIRIPYVLPPWSLRHDHWPNVTSESRGSSWGNWLNWNQYFFRQVISEIVMSFVQKYGYWYSSSELLCYHPTESLVKKKLNLQSFILLGEIKPTLRIQKWWESKSFSHSFRIMSCFLYLRMIQNRSQITTSSRRSRRILDL